MGSLKRNTACFQCVSLLNGPVEKLSSLSSTGSSVIISGGSISNPWLSACVASPFFSPAIELLRSPLRRFSLVVLRRRSLITSPTSTSSEFIFTGCSPAAISPRGLKNVSNHRINARAYTRFWFGFVETYGPAAFLAATLVGKSSADRENGEEDERDRDVITCRFRSCTRYLSTHDADCEYGEPTLTTALLVSTVSTGIASTVPSS